MTRVRFATIPAGHLSVATAWAALANALHARRLGGDLLLRFDDVEPERCRAEYAEAILHDLQWLGIRPDQVVRQSERIELYADAIEQLKQAGRLYPCFESEDELRAKRDHRQRRGLAQVYDRAMLRLTSEQRASAEAHGKRPYWRFRLSDSEMHWDDAILGRCGVKLPSVSDPILLRADGRPLPLLAGILDDIALDVSHAIHGSDHLTATAIQQDISQALGVPRAIRYAHLPGIEEPGTAKTARRIAGRTLRSLRNDGIEVVALATYLARLGTSQAPDPMPLEVLVQDFDPARIAASPARFDPAQLLATNRRVLGQFDFAAVADRLPSGATETFWLAVRGKLDLLKEARGWWDVVAGTIVPPAIEQGREILGVAKDLLPAEPWNDDVCAEWVDALSRATRRDPGSLLAPLRLALTGEDGGPELGELLPLMGRARAVNRLQVAASS